MIRHFENNNEKLLQCYQYGYDTMRKQFKAFEKFMEDKSSPRQRGSDFSAKNMED